MANLGRGTGLEHFVVVIILLRLVEVCLPQLQYQRCIHAAARVLNAAENVLAGY